MAAPELYSRTRMAGWGDMDLNAHMRNTAFLDKSADVRMMFFADHGFPAHRFTQLGFGPVIRNDRVDYFREIALLDKFDVSLQLAGLAPDGSRFMLRNEFHRSDGKQAATVTSMGGWLDLRERRLIAPPDEIIQALQSLRQSEDFATLPSSLNRAAT